MEPVAPRRRPQSVLVATSIATGTQRREFDSTLGIDFGSGEHRFTAGRHILAGADDGRLPEIIAGRSDSEPDFWPAFVQRATAAAMRLIGTARSVASLAATPCDRDDLHQGYLALLDVMREMSPVMMAAPSAIAVLRSQLSRRLGLEAGESVAAEVLPRLLTPWGQPDPMGDVHDGYRIAVAIMDDEAAAEIFRETAPKIALRRMAEDFGYLHQMILDHIETYGWLRTQGYRHAPPSPEDLTYRVQLALIRWSPDAIRRAAHIEAARTTEQVLGFSPSEELADRIAALQAVVSQRIFAVDIFLQAECIARPFLAAVAEELRCSTEQVLFASPDAVVAGLLEQAALRREAIEARIRNGFTVQRQGDTVTVDALERPADDDGTPAQLTGATACRGTAVGRVRIILDQTELLQLQVGDILVTAASTIDPTDQVGETTVFPSRNGGPYADALLRAAAVVADEGGLLSHAAIVCRERGLPCVLGAEVATTTLVDGQVVEVDATKPVGVVIAL